MKQRTIYIANDNTEFADEATCENYERSCVSAASAAEYFRKEGVSERKVMEYQRVIKEWLFAADDDRG